jgi:hypothetical protein
MPTTNDKSRTIPYPTEQELNTLDNRIWALAKKGNLRQEEAALLCNRYGEKAVIESLVGCCDALHDRYGRILTLVNEPPCRVKRG